MIKKAEILENVVLTIFNDKWAGLRLFGKAKLYESGEYYDFCYKTFFPKGVDLKHEFICSKTW